MIEVKRCGDSSRVGLTSRPGRGEDATRQSAAFGALTVLTLPVESLGQLLKVIALFCGAITALTVGWYLWRKPPLGKMTKVILLFGLGVMPLAASLAGNVAGFEHTMKRDFCASCHVMLPYSQDAEDPESQSLAAIHSRNGEFGAESCYTCHADYAMFGAATTKANGLKHLYAYVTDYAETGPYGEGGPPIHMYKPFRNGMCSRCHSTSAPAWKAREDHAGMLEEIRSGDAACIDCHTNIHPRAFAHGGTGAAPAATR
jgi:cytochrome c-type protein NapC